MVRKALAKQAKDDATEITSIDELKEFFLGTKMNQVVAKTMKRPIQWAVLLFGLSK